MFMNIPFILLQCATFFYLISTAGYFCYLFYQKNRIQQTALGAVGIGTVVHLVAIVLQSAALGGLPIYRITSYNVCYTKLLREKGNTLYLEKRIL